MPELRHPVRGAVPALALLLAAGAALAHPASRMWAGYWQRGRV